MLARKFISIETILLSVYALSNALFVYKYSARLTINPLLASFAYLVFLILLLVILYRNQTLKIPIVLQRRLFIAFVLTCAVALAVLMRQFDPAQFRIGRYNALHDWISRLLAGQFPYASTANPSGMPFIFILALPFYFLGDLGLFQIFAFLLFAAAVYKRSSNNLQSALGAVVLLLLAPIFIFEVVTRSELISNMICIIIYLEVLEILIPRAKPVSLAILGIGAGLLLSTRLVGALILGCFLMHLFKRKIGSGILFLIFISAGFLATLLPFVIWDREAFMRPLQIQSSYAPAWLIVAALMISIIAGALARTPKAAYTSIALTLFSAVAAAFLITVSSEGWAAAVTGSGFDISYFGFPLPFLLLSLILPEQGISGVDKPLAAN